MRLLPEQRQLTTTRFFLIIAVLVSFGVLCFDPWLYAYANSGERTPETHHSPKVLLVAQLGAPALPSGPAPATSQPAAPEAPQAGAAPAPAAAPEPSPAPPTPAPQSATVPIALHLDNADLTQVIGIIAGELHMNYVIDPTVKGSVNINTLGDVRREDLFPLLQLILRVNGATAVQSGNFFRITPLQTLQRIPVEPQIAGSELSPDDRIVMNIIPLKYVAAADMSKILTPFLSEGGHLLSHDAGNVLIVTDSSRNMKRLLDLVAELDTDEFSNQRARLFPVQSSEADVVAKELEQVFSAYGMSGTGGGSAVRFVPINRINSILVVTANPSVYSEVEKWMERLDQPMAPSGIRTFIYKVENAKASDLASVLSVIYAGTPASTPAGGPTPRGGGAVQPGNMQSPGGTGSPNSGSAAVVAAAGEMGPGSSHIRIVADTVNNQLIIQSTGQEYEDMKRTLRDLDIVPRQVMIEAKVYEVDLTGALSAGVSAFLQNQGAGTATLPGGERKLQGSFATDASGSPALNATIGTLVGKTRELLLFLNAAESHNQARVISAPAIMASDNIPANINVGESIPILTSQALAGGAQAAGSSLFTNTIQNQDTGVLLTITPRINSSGLVHMQIQQEVSTPLAPTGPIQSPSIQKRTLSTEVVLQDGQTLALGGIIQDSRTLTKNRLPLLGDIPYVGALFGTTSTSSQRTELVILITPTVIRDSSEAQRASAEFLGRLKGLHEMIDRDNAARADSAAKK